jgi:hypothetical protein
MAGMMIKKQKNNFFDNFFKITAEPSKPTDSDALRVIQPDSSPTFLFSNRYSERRGRRSAQKH